MKKIFVILGIMTFMNVFAANKKADVELKDKDGKVIGIAHLTESKKGVKIKLEVVEGITPGVHGFHIHENGKCEGPTFESAGSHFNPDHQQHGDHNPQGKHMGDLGNIKIENNSKGKATAFVKAMNLGNDVHGLKKEGGTSIVIHESADDQKTDPSGNSGARVACGEIK